MKDIIRKIDYTDLRDDIPFDELEDLCFNAHKLGVASICIKPSFITTAKDIIIQNQLKLKICTVISFPHGDDHTSVKEQDTFKALKKGADEIDVVLDYKLLRSIENSYFYLTDQVRKIKGLCDMFNATLKVIVESGELTTDKIERATYICLDGDADFIKTSTGKTKNGASLEAVKIIHDLITYRKHGMKIKASGGIRTMEDIELYKPYVDRFGIGYQSVNGIVHNEVIKNDNY